MLKKIMMLGLVFSMIMTINAQEKEKGNQEKEIEKNAPERIKDREKDKAEDEALLEVSAEVKVKKAEIELEIAEAELEAVLIAHKKSSSLWLTWLWPFGDDDEEKAVEEKPVIAEPVETVEVTEVVGEEPVSMEEVPKEVPVVSGDAPGEKKEGVDFTHKLIYYFPNFFLNLDDTFSFTVGAGAESGVKVGITQWFGLGGLYGESYFMEKGFKRQIGGGHNKGYIFQIGPFVSENRSVDHVIGSVKPYKLNQATVPTPSESIFTENIRDFWGIGMEASWFVKFGFQLHPVQIADFFTGIFFIDICDDDL